MNIYGRINKLLDKIMVFQSCFSYHSRIKSDIYHKWWNEIDKLISKIKRDKRYVYKYNPEDILKVV